MPYIAELQIKVDSSQIESATQKLKDLTQATAGSAKAEDGSRKAKEQSSAAAVAAEQRAARAEQARYDQWFNMASRRDKEEARLQARRDAIMARDIRDSATAASAREQANARANAAEQKRYDLWLQNAERQAQQELKQIAQLEAARAKAAQDSQAAQIKAAQAVASAEAQAQKEALREQQRIDNIRYQATLRRYSEEEKLAARNKKANSNSAHDAEAKSLQNLLAAIDPVTRELQRLDALEKQLQANRGKLTTEQYTKYQGAIEEARKSAERYNDTLGRTSLSAKQLRNAQQGLPAQFTDIVVSLQGGQAPLTVLLQQGGQLKDMFGGVGAALKGMGTYIMGLVNPITVSAAAIATLGAIWYDGGNQLKKLNGAIALTGTYSGQTTDQLLKMAEAHGQNISSVRQNIEALAQLTNSTKLLPETYGKVAEAATSMSTVSGVALDKIIDDFASLGDEPVKAAIKLNEKYHFLTDTIYQNAQALVEHGKEQEAIKLLTDSLADTVEARAKDMQNSARGVAKAWNIVSNSISNAITAAGRGLNPTDGSELEGVKNRLRIFREGFEDRPQMYETNPEYLMLLQKELELTEKIGIAEKKAKEERTDQRAEEAAFAAREASWKKEQLGWDAVKRAKVELRKFDEKLPLAGDKLNEADKTKLRQPYLDAIKKAEDAEAKKNKPKTPKSAIIDDRDVNELSNKINEIKSKYAELTESVKTQQESGTLSAEAGFAKRQQLLTDETAKIKAAYQDQITALEALKGSKNISTNQSISLDKKIADARSKMVVAETSAQKELDKSAAAEEKRLRRQTQNVKAYNDTLDQMVKNLRVAGERDRAGLSMGSGERGVNDQLNSEDDRYNDEVRGLNNQRAENPQLESEVAQKLELAATAHSKMKDQILANYDEMTVAQRDWGAGIKSAFQQYIEDGANYANLTNQAFSSAFGSMEDAIVSFVTTGKASFSDLAKSILADMARIAVKAAASAALQSIFGAVAGAYAGGAPTAAAGASMNSATAYNSGMMAAKGAAFTGGTQFFAKGGAFTNSVVSKPTAFSTNSSPNNIMGEAGPEAIMPLSRGSDGSLGVRASVDVSGLQQQASGGGVNVYVNIAGDGKTSTSSDDPGYSSFGNEIGVFVDQRYRQLLSKDLSPGGDIWKSQQK